MDFNTAATTTTDPATAARRHATTPDVGGSGGGRPPIFTRGAALPSPLARATSAYYLAGVDPILLGPLLDDLAQRYLATNEVTPVLYHAEDAQRLQRSLDMGPLRRLNTVYSYQNSGQLPAPDIDRLPGLLADPGSSGLMARSDQAAWIVLNSLHRLPPMDSAGFAGHLSRHMPGLQQVDVLLHGHPGNESGEVLLPQGNRRNTIITAPQIASTLGRLGIGEDHTVALQACHSADTDHPTSPTPSALGDATAHTFGAALRRAFNDQPNNPRLVTARHGWGLYGPTDGNRPGAALPRSEERSLTGPLWAHEQRYAPWMRTGEDTLVHMQLQEIPTASFQAVYPSGPGALPHARAQPALPVLPASLARHVATQTDRLEAADHRLAPATASATVGPAGVVGLPAGITAVTTRETQTDAGLPLPPSAGAECQTETDVAMTTPQFVYPAPRQPVPAGAVAPTPIAGAEVATADVGVQTFAIRDIGTQAGSPLAVPGVGVGLAPAVASVQTQTTAMATRPAIVQTTQTYFDPALRPPTAVYPFTGPGEVGVQANLDGTHPAAH